MINKFDWQLLLLLICKRSDHWKTDESQTNHLKQNNGFEKSKACSKGNDLWIDCWRERKGREGAAQKQIYKNIHVLFHSRYFVASSPSWWIKKEQTIGVLIASAFTNLKRRTNRFNWNEIVFSPDLNAAFETSNGWNTKRFTLNHFYIRIGRRRRESSSFRKCVFFATISDGSSSKSITHTHTHTHSRGRIRVEVLNKFWFGWWRRKITF